MRTRAKHVVRAAHHGQGQGPCGLRLNLCIRDCVWAEHVGHDSEQQSLDHLCHDAMAKGVGVAATDDEVVLQAARGHQASSDMVSMGWRKQGTIRAA